MVYDKASCIAYKDELDKYLGPDASTIVMSKTRGDFTRMGQVDARRRRAGAGRRSVPAGVHTSRPAPAGLHHWPSRLPPTNDHAGRVRHDDREAAYNRTLTGRINARYGEALNVWQDRILEYVGKRDTQTGEMAKYLDQLARKGIDAERVLDLAAARKPLPVDHPTAALAYRVKDLVTPRRRRPAPSIDPFPRPTQQQSSPSLGL